MNNTVKCERCTAKDGEKHPLLGFLVEVSEVKINDEIQLLCQRCKVHRLLKTQREMEDERKSSTVKGFLKSIFK